MFSREREREREGGGWGRTERERVGGGGGQKTERQKHLIVRNKYSSAKIVLEEKYIIYKHSHSTGHENRLNCE